MAEERIKSPEEEQGETALPPNPAKLEAQALIDLRKENERLAKENAQLNEAKKDFYDRVLNGQEAGTDNGPKPKSVEECRKELIEVAKKGGTNLEYCEKALELNEASIRETGESCFLPKGKQVKSPTADEIALAERFPKVIQECIDKSEGNPDAFNMQLKMHMK